MLLLETESLQFRLYMAYYDLSGCDSSCRICNGMSIGEIKGDVPANMQKCASVCIGDDVEAELQRLGESE